MTPLIWLLRTPVTVSLAGRRYEALPLRLGDLAWLASLACARWERPAVPSLDPATTEGRAAWLAACDAVDAPPPDWGSDECFAVAFGTPVGRANMLAAVLRDCRISYVAAKELAEKLTAEEWAAVDRIALAIDVAREVQDGLVSALGIPGMEPGKARTLAEVVAETAAELQCAPGDLAKWTVGELREFRAGGKAVEPFMFDDPEGDPERTAWYHEHAREPLEAFFRGPSSEGSTEGQAESECPADPS